MPSSSLFQINEIIELMVLTKPESILDVGVGFGKYGFLAREYLEIWNGFERYGEWKKVIDGIEAFQHYITPVHEFVYNHIYIGDALEIIPKLEGTYDLALLIDVIEHLSQDDGRLLLRELRRKAKNIIISTPKHFIPQSDHFGNPYEVHRSVWRKGDFKEFKDVFFIRNDRALICYMGEKAPYIRRYYTKKSIKKMFPGPLKLYRFIKNKCLNPFRDFLRKRGS